jgi:glycosyltransferase involved in cell wall biosynthesis
MTSRATLVGVPRLFTEARVIEIDVAAELPNLVPGPVGEPAACLVVARLCGEPVGMVGVPEAIDGEQLAGAIWYELGPRLRQMLPAHGVPGGGSALSRSGIPHSGCRVRKHRARARAQGPAVTVVVCTRNRPESLRRCLQSLASAEYDRFEVLVVDNAPDDSRTHRVCVELSSSGVLPLRYVLEPTPGLSVARNTALRHVEDEIVAFVDDDERVDPLFLGAVAEEFRADPNVGAVSGLVLPGELRTAAQAQFEQFGGHSKGRGFTRAVFDEAYVKDTQSALYPLPPFGVGANMAFRAAVLKAAGGFDVALGAGTRTKGAEDTAAFAEVMLHGWTMVYAPAAVTWHYHREDQNALREQMRGYGIGLGAFYAAMIARDPRRLLPLLRLAPRGISDLVRRDSLRNATLSELPPEIGRGNLLGILSGPGAYVRARREARRRRASRASRAET